MNLVRVLADFGRLDDPEKTGRLLGTRFRPEGSSEHYDADPRICMGEQPNERQTRSSITTIYVPDAPFWFTDEMRMTGGQPSSMFGYTVTQITPCKGTRYTQAKVSFGGIFRLFCVHVADVLATPPTGLKGGAPIPEDPNWSLYWDAWVSEDTGTRAILNWDHTGNVDEHGECLREVVLRQDPIASARDRRIWEQMKKNARLLGPGTGAAVSATPK